MRKWPLILALLPSLASAQSLPTPPDQDAKAQVDDLANQADAKYRQAMNLMQKIADLHAQIEQQKAALEAKMPEYYRAQHAAAEHRATGEKQ